MCFSSNFFHERSALTVVSIQSSIPNSMSRAPTLTATLGKIGDAALERTLVAVAGASAHVACALRTTMMQTANEFRDDVLTVDLVADKIRTHTDYGLVSKCTYLVASPCRGRWPWLFPITPP